MIFCSGILILIGRIGWNVTVKELKEKYYSSFFPRLTEWVILGVARQYYTLKTGLITSKTKAGQYVLQHLPKEYHEILREAVQIRNDNNRKMLTFKKSYSVNPSLKRYRKTIACARYIINQFNEDYKTLNTHD